MKERNPMTVATATEEMKLKKVGKGGKCDKEGKMMSAEFDFFLGWVWWGGDGVGWGESR